MLSLIFLSGLILALAGTGIVIPWLRVRQILDQPNQRSSHTQPTIKGAGLALVVSIIIMFFLIDLDLEPINFPINRFMTSVLLVALVILALISWLDDLYGLPVLLRLFIHLIAIASVLFANYEKLSALTTVVPGWAWFLFLLGLWSWFTNIFNFMDGIDGLSGVESVSICLGIIIVAAVTGWNQLGQDYALALAGISLGFLWWNWQPAKVFLGDVGSIPLGFLLGWLLLGLAFKGYYLQAIILPLYYILDATLTITIRLFYSRNIWESHRDHFYQRAVQGGLSHSKVSLTVAVLNSFLIGFSVLALYFPVLGLLASVIVVVLTLIYFGTRKPVRV